MLIPLLLRRCGLCHSDLKVIKGATTFPLPAVMGHEISGEVVTTGEGVEQITSIDLSPGRRVVVPFILPCLSCLSCAKGREDLCEIFASLNRRQGFLHDGTTRLFRIDGSPVSMYSMAGLATHSVVPAQCVFALSDAAPWSESAIIGCSVFTAYGAVKHGADVKAGETVAVIGTGGVGQSVIQICKAVGAAQIIAVDITDNKLEQMKRLGATDTINSKTSADLQSAILALTNGLGVDVCFESLGSPETFQQAVSAVSRGGRAVIVGTASPGVVVPIEINALVRKGVRLIGSYGARARLDMPIITKMVETGQIDVRAGVSRIYQLHEASDAYRDLRDGKIIGRAIIQMF